VDQYAVCSSFHDRHMCLTVRHELNSHLISVHRWNAIKLNATFRGTLIWHMLYAMAILDLQWDSVHVIW
jgi:hypothetical protein